MVRAILEDRKTVTRRVVKPQHLRVLDSQYHKEHLETPDNVLLERLCEPPFLPGNILYVRETWERSMAGTYLYKATDTPLIHDGWRPSIHMPKEAARIFLRVTDVRVERLQDITPEQIDAEGCKEWGYSVEIGELMPSSPCYFSITWNHTVKPTDRALYSWDTNPWVWVIAFERINRKEAGL